MFKPQAFWLLFEFAYHTYSIFRKTFGVKITYIQQHNMAFVIKSIFFQRHKKKEICPEFKREPLVMDYRLISHYARVCDASLPWLPLGANELDLTGRRRERRTEDWAVNRFYSMTHTDTKLGKSKSPTICFHKSVIEVKARQHWLEQTATLTDLRRVITVILVKVCTEGNRGEKKQCLAQIIKCNSLYNCV